MNNTLDFTTIDSPLRKVVSTAASLPLLQQ